MHHNFSQISSQGNTFTCDYNKKKVPLVSNLTYYGPKSYNPVFDSMVSIQGNQIWALVGQIGPNWKKIRDFFSRFRIMCLGDPKCTESELKKISGFVSFGPIYYNIRVSVWL